MLRNPEWFIFLNAGPGHFYERDKPYFVDIRPAMVDIGGGNKLHSDND